MEFTQDEVTTVRGYLDHEAGHVRHTDFTNVPAFGKIHGVEAHRIANCLEDIRLENLVFREYPGAEKNIRGLFDHIGPQEKEFISGNPDLFGEKPTIHNVTSAITSMGREDYLSQQYKDDIYPFLQEKYKAWGRKWAEEAKNCKNTNEVLNLALKIKELLETSQQNQEQQDKGEEPTGGEGLDGNPEDFTFDPNGNPVDGKSKEGQGKSKEGQGKVAPSEDISSYCDKLLKDKVDKFLKYQTTGKKVKYRVFSTKHDEVYSTTSVNKRKDRRVDDMRNGTAAAYESVKSRIGGQVNTMKARLRRALMAKERRDWDFGREFGRLDTKRLVAGFQGTAGVYKQRKDRMEHDTSVMMLVDLSGSMSNQKVKVAMESVIAFCECLEGTQIKFEVNGFDNGEDGCGSDYWKEVEKAKQAGGKWHRTEPLDIFQFKEFTEPLRSAKGAISAIHEMANGNNSDNDAVLWCLQRLSEQRTSRKILIVLSDGSPANYTIGSARDELTKALTQTVESAKKDYGVECVGLGIMASHVTQIYKNSVVINNIQDLSGEIFRKLSELLTVERLVS